MKLLLNNGTIIEDAPIMTEKTKNYLNKFWKFPNREDLEKKKSQYYIRDCKRFWQEKINTETSKINDGISPV